MVVPHLTILVFKFYFSFAYRIRKPWSCEEKIKLSFIYAKSTLYLNEEALFYLKSRGICERNARALLMYAFANEVVNFVEIDSLRERLLDMTQKRLSGELSACSHCAFPCGEAKSFSFKIDLSKI